MGKAVEEWIGACFLNEGDRARTVESGRGSPHKLEMLARQEREGKERDETERILG